MKLFTAPGLSGLWIGEDEQGALVQWPRTRRGWLKRTPYEGSRRGLHEVAPALARGSGWPGAGTGRRPRSAAGTAATINLAIRITPEEREAWDRAAGDEPVTAWARRELNVIAARKRH